MRTVNYVLRIAASGSLLALTIAVPGFAQETPNDTVSSTPSATPVLTATPAPARSVRISFIPPPLEGRISLGVFDSSGKLVRVLHREADLNQFTVGPDALLTKWDGKDDEGNDLPPGKYSAHGYVVGALTIEKLEDADDAATPTPATDEKVKIKLMANPLLNGDRPTLELAAGFDNQHSFLKTGDNLPLYTISEGRKVGGASLIRNADKSVEVWEMAEDGTQRLRISHLDRIMAFDCGGFELK